MRNINKWEKIWEVGDAPIFEMGQGTLFSLKKQAEIFKYTTNGMLLYGEKEFLSAYHCEEDLNAAGKHGENFFLNQKRYRALISSFDKILKDINLREAVLSQKLNEAKSVEDCKTLLSEVSNLQQEVFAYFNTTNPQFTNGLEIKLKDSLSRRFKESVNEIIIKLTHYKKLSTLQTEQMLFFSLVTNYWAKLKKLHPMNSDTIENITNFNSKLENHLAKFQFINGNEGVDSWDKDYYINLINELISNNKNPKTELDNIKLNHENAIRLKEKYIKDNSIHKKTRLLAEILGELGYYRLELRITWSVYFRILRQIIYKISRLIQVPAYELLALSPQEIKDNKLDKPQSLHKLALNRYNNYLFLISGEKYTGYFGQKAMDRFKKEIPQTNKQRVTKIYGETAFAGQVEGKAYCMNWGDENLNQKIIEMPQGVILVIGNTRPSLMPAIRKAKAIITDEGGITSHAAIVSRELKIPCLIGTKNATKLIYSGAYLRVDCKNGFVEII